MNLDEAIQKHAEWKVKFRSAIAKKEKMDATTIRADNCCILGKWLHNEGKIQYGTKGSFTTVVARHADFHRIAGKVADTINAGNYDAAEKMLDAGTDYAQASSAVAVAIMGLKKDI